MVKGVVGLLIVFLILGGVGSIFAYIGLIPNPGHGGDKVFIYVNGIENSLQNAIDTGEFNSEFVGVGSYSQNILDGHKGEEIIVNINGDMKSLQNAINDGSLCATEAGVSPSNFGTYIYGNNGDEILISISGTEKLLQQAINDGDFYKCPPGPCAGPGLYDLGYSLNYMGRHRQCTGVSAGSWIHAIQNNVVQTQTSEIIYSTTQGNWIPVNTYTETLRLNVNGDNTLYCSKHPVPILKAVYRVWGNTKVSVKTYTRAEATGSPGTLTTKINRIDSFQRQDAITILVGPTPITINAEASYDVQRVTWNPADHGSGQSYLRIKNDLCGDYFDIEIYIDEADEQYDSSRVWIESYIEPA